MRKLLFVLASMKEMKDLVWLTMERHWYFNLSKKATATLTKDDVILLCSCNVCTLSDEPQSPFQTLRVWNAAEQIKMFFKRRIIVSNLPALNHFWCGARIRYLSVYFTSSIIS